MTGSNVAAEVDRLPSSHECRVSERFSCDVAASCQPPSAWKSGGRDWPARVRDLSSGGLRLVLGRRFEPGAGLAIEVTRKDDDSPSTLLARVIHVRSEGNGSWSLGCSLVSPLSDEELQTLVGGPPAASAPPPAPADRPFLADVHFRGLLPHGEVVERLIRKLYVKRSWPLARGRVIGVRLRAFSDDPVVRVRVDACRSVGDRSVLECTFMDAAPASLQNAELRMQNAE